MWANEGQPRSPDWVSPLSQARNVGQLSRHNALRLRTAANVQTTSPNPDPVCFFRREWPGRHTVTRLDNSRGYGPPPGMPLLLRRSLALLVVLLSAGCATKPTPPAASGDLQARLLGTWVLEKAAVPGTPSGVGLRRKTFTPGHWEMEQKNPTTGAIVFRHGGTYRLQGDIIESTTTFANKSTANRIGQVSSAKIKVEGDVYTQVGLDNPFTETWRRVPPSDLAK